MSAPSAHFFRQSPLASTKATTAAAELDRLPLGPLGVMQADYSLHLRPGPATSVPGLNKLQSN
jgi:hypothetical protein